MLEKTQTKGIASILLLLASLAFFLTVQTEQKLLFFLTGGVLLILAIVIWQRQYRVTNPRKMRLFNVSMVFFALAGFTAMLAWLREQPLLLVVAGTSLIVAFVTYRQHRLNNSNSST